MHCLQITSMCNSSESPLRLGGSQEQGNLKHHTLLYSSSALGSPLHCQPEVSASAHLDLALVKHKLLPALEHPYFAGELQDTLASCLLTTLSPYRFHCTETIRAAPPHLMQAPASTEVQHQTHTSNQVWGALSIPTQAGLCPFVLSLG